MVIGFLILDRALFFDQSNLGKAHYGDITRVDVGVCFIWTWPKVVPVPEQYFRGAGRTEAKEQRLTRSPSWRLEASPSRSRREAADAAGVF